MRTLHIALIIRKNHQKSKRLPNKNIPTHRDVFKVYDYESIILFSPLFHLVFIFPPFYSCTLIPSSLFIFFSKILSLDISHSSSIFSESTFSHPHTTTTVQYQIYIPDLAHLLLPHILRYLPTETDTHPSPFFYAIKMHH